MCSSDLGLSLRLHVEEMGDGGLTAILVHGLLSDHGAWCRVAPALAARGYRLLMPDLRGHGLSPRGEYTPEAWAADLAENLPRGADLAIGHSLGGMALAIAVGELSPRRAVFVDPAWKTTPQQDLRYGLQFHAELDFDAVRLRAAHPLWADEDIAARIASMARFDPACIDALVGGDGHDYAPKSLVTRSLVMLADPSDLVPAPDARALQAAGFDVVAVPGSGHSVFRDDLDGFFAALDAWLLRRTASSW